MISFIICVTTDSIIFLILSPTYSFSCKGILAQCILNPCSLYLNILPLNICMVNSLTSFNSCSNELSMELNCRAPLLNSSPILLSILYIFFSLCLSPSNILCNLVSVCIVCILYLNVSSWKAALCCFHLLMYSMDTK